MWWIIGIGTGVVTVVAVLATMVYAVSIIDPVREKEKENRKETLWQ